MSARKWIAWKLVRLASRLYDAEWAEQITISPPGAETIVIEVVGDEYGCGISSTSGIHWQVGKRFETADIEGWKFTWHEPERRADLENHE